MGVSNSSPSTSTLPPPLRVRRPRVRCTPSCRHATRGNSSTCPAPPRRDFSSNNWRCSSVMRRCADCRRNSTASTVLDQLWFYKVRIYVDSTSPQMGTVDSNVGYMLAFAANNDADMRRKGFPTGCWCRRQHLREATAKTSRMGTEDSGGGYRRCWMWAWPGWRLSASGRRRSRPRPLLLLRSPLQSVPLLKLRKWPFLVHISITVKNKLT